ncbi:MAG: V-type ATP synthase subunit I [Candidatus Diapherotrites archaeon]
MLRPEKMVKVKAIGLNADVDEVTAFLQEKGIAEIKKSSDVRLESGKIPAMAGAASEQLVRMKAIEGELEKGEAAQAKKLPLNELLEKSKSIIIDKELNALNEEKRELEEEKATLSGSKKVLEQLGKTGIDLSLLQQNRLAFFVGKLQTQKIPELRSAVEHATNRFVLQARELNKFESIVVLAVDKKAESEAEAIAGKTGFTKILLPANAKEPEKMLESVEKRLWEIGVKEKAIQEKKASLSMKFYPEIASLREMLEIESERFEAQTKYGFTGKTFALEAWIEAKKFSELKESLGQRFNKRIHLAEVKTDEAPPSLLKNPKFFLPFQHLIEFMSVPGSREFDPTVIVAIIFPIFYGMMLGDAGYGILSLFLGLLIAKKTKGILSDLGMVWAYAAIPTILFGILFDEYLGFSFLQLTGMELPFHAVERLANVQFLLLVTVLMGITHVTLGFVLGFLKELEHHNMNHALGKLGWIAVELGAVSLVALFLMGGLDMLVVGGIGIAILVGLVLIWRAEGLIGVVELPSLASNLLSYSRILAIGLSSLAIAMVINLLLNPADNIIFLPFFLVGHAFNLVLGMFESFIQGGRLNLVEFFSKFYKGTGQRFSPFKLKKKLVA